MASFIKESKSLSTDTVHQGDCVELLKQVKPGTVDLVFADPPFNIGYEYDVYDDERGSDDYLGWCEQWITGVKKCLKPDGTFWLAIGDEYAAELKVMSQQVGFVCRSWVIWYYTFGVNCSRGFSRSHTHLFHFVVDPKRFKFNAVNPQIRVPSARQLVYGDARANPDGRLPDNTWILRPQDSPTSFRPDHDTWYFPRVAGTFKEREGFHGCQMPEQLLGRIVRSSSDPVDLVLDPFSGSGTTLRVAKKLGRRWMGFELSKEYAENIRRRMSSTQIDEPLTGPEDPLKSAPSTSKGKRRKSKLSDQQLEEKVIKAFVDTAEGRSVDYMICDPDLCGAFVKANRDLGNDGNEVMWISTLLKLRKSKKLQGATQKNKRVSFAEMDDYSHASEIAMHLLSVDFGQTIERILSKKTTASQFDQLARQLAPGFSPFQYRWAALAMRKRAHSAKIAGASHEEWRKTRRLPRWKNLERLRDEFDVPGVYVLASDSSCLYVGETENISRRLGSLLENEYWRELEPIRGFAVKDDTKNRLGIQSALIGRLQPLMNSRLLVPVLE